MQRGSDKHGPRSDDRLAYETEGIVRSGHDTRAEDWKRSEPSGEGQPDVDRAPDETLTGGTPTGMDEAEVGGRAELGSYLNRAAFPAVREMLIDDAVGNQAPDAVVAAVERLPSGREYANVGEVWETLGDHREERRF